MNSRYNKNTKNIVLCFLLIFFLINPVSHAVNISENTNKIEKITSMKSDKYDYVVITKESIIPFIQDFINWEITKGYTVKIVTISWIQQNYEGYDVPAYIRTFLRENYQDTHWGIKNVLLIGNTTDIPMRMVSRDKGYGNPYTDFYYAELSLSDEKSWDADGDYKYGESEDSCDLYPEIILGRIPFSSPSAVSNVLNNTISFEQNNNAMYKKHMLLMGAFFWNDTDNAALMEEIKRQPGLQDWTATTLFENNTDHQSTYDPDYPLSKENVITAWNNHSAAFVNWAGHGTPISAHILGLNQQAFISAYNIKEFKDVKPAVIFANACNNANPAYPNIALEMMKQMAIGFIGPSIISQAKSNWQGENSGSSQSFNFLFAKYFLSGTGSLGESHQYALQEMYNRGLWYDPYFETFTWGTLYGIPDLLINAIGNFPDLNINNIKGGQGISFDIINDGDALAINVSWDISISGGRKIITKTQSGNISALQTNMSETIHVTVLGFGFGYFSPQPTIRITVKTSNITPITQTVKANIFGPFISII